MKLLFWSDALLLSSISCARPKILSQHDAATLFQQENFHPAVMCAAIDFLYSTEKYISINDIPQPQRSPRPIR
jgi:hypothetical protein